mmetsp:Transcript_22029/g.40414  ORF Transcript_22029/g.40414 Transcript_22029/m.40414 type:complete len:141 (+) Transcript_22029:1703-2125(+)
MNPVVSDGSCHNNLCRRCWRYVGRVGLFVPVSIITMILVMILLYTHPNSLNLLNRIPLIPSVGKQLARSPHSPTNTLLPLTKTNIESTRFKKWEACVTNTTAVLAKSPLSPEGLNNFSNTFFPVPASNAESGSSNIATSG